VDVTDACREAGLKASFGPVCVYIRNPTAAVGTVLASPFLAPFVTTREAHTGDPERFLPLFSATDRPPGNIETAMDGKLMWTVTRKYLDIPHIAISFAPDATTVCEGHGWLF
jgi:hypothetical protein